MESLLIEDVHYAVRFIPKDLRKIIIDNKLLVAGGFLRAIVAREKVSDIDLFGPSVDVLQDVSDRLADKWNTKAVRTRNAITVHANGRTPVQFITRWLFSDPAEIIKSFDFTIAQACLWPTTQLDERRRATVSDPHGHEPVVDDESRLIWASLCSPRFYPDLAAKRIVYTAPQRNEDAGGSMLRVIKFLGREYTISPASLGAVMARMASRIRWESGICQDEPGKAKVLTGLLRQVDPLLAIDGIELGIEETVSVEEIEDALHPTAFGETQPIPDTAP